MKTNILLILLFTIFLYSCNNYYSIEDFPSVEKIDAHYHIYNPKSISMEQANKDNFKLLSINTHSGNCERVVDAHQWLKSMNSENPSSFEFTTTFCLDNWDEPGWKENTISWIDQCVADGANSVKVWKNIGMEFRDKDSVLIMIDDPKFDAIFKHIAELGIPLVGHLGEPKACWQPIEKMKANNNKNYFKQNPQYHMYLHPEFPTYEEQMNARDRMLEKNPNLVFIGCHLASLEWSVDEIAKFLDHFPNASVDMAARMGDLFYQTRDDHEKVRKFFINYQDRLLYGTDITDNGGDKESFHKRMHDTWIRDWEYLVTDNKMTSNLIDGEFLGLKLPKEVVDKIYSENTKKWYKSF
ncbi:MAG: amidohydrolase family protein [Bacteroidetes bacterium]|nr:amidohydrolase family protein [Bacteroidota bacterium]